MDVLLAVVQFDVSVPGIMIDQKLIRGIGENGMEYTVIAQVLNLPKDIVDVYKRQDLGLPEDAILERLQKKLNISLQTAQEYLKTFGKQIVKN